jgi:radical SAM protein with 4Fe4S-binding SPASM domain
VNQTQSFFDEMVYFRVHEGCNLHCDHCFIPKNPKRIRDKDIDSIFNSFSNLFIPGKVIKFQWHGGEPTLAGKDMFYQVISYLEDNYPETTFQHTIQTNLINFDSEWGELYKQHFNSEVGVSWDYGIRKYAGSFPVFSEKFWRNFASLKGMGLSPYLVVTATKALFEGFKNPIDFLTFLQEKGVHYLHIERLTNTGLATENWGEIGITNNSYSTWMSKLYKAYRAFKDTNPDYSLFISPFDGLDAALKESQDASGIGYGCWSTKCDSNFHTIDANGYKKGCTAVNSEVDNTNKISKKKPAELVYFDVELLRGKRKDLCQGCEFYSWCSSGCTAVQYDDGSGECSGSKKLLTTILKKPLKF